jgi:hypothetical protein
MVRRHGAVLRGPAEETGEREHHDHGEGADDPCGHREQEIARPQRPGGPSARRRRWIAGEQLAWVNPGPIEGMRRRAVRFLVPCLLGGHAAECNDAIIGADRALMALDDRFRTSRQAAARGTSGIRPYNDARGCTRGEH